MQIDERSTLIIATLTLIIGRELTKRVPFLKNYFIPEAVSGGLAAAVVVLLVEVLVGTSITFDLESRDLLLIVFFTCIGLNTRLNMLQSAGKTFLVMVVGILSLMVLQNVMAFSFGAIIGLDSADRLMCGSISLAGGHGTTIAWGTYLRTIGIDANQELGLAFSTLGLVLGGIIGGPFAGYLINKYNIPTSSRPPLVVGIYDEKTEVVKSETVFSLLMVLAITVTVGVQIADLFDKAGVQLPLFAACLLAGIVLTNTIPNGFPTIKWPANTTTIALASDVSLGLFLVMSMMSLKLLALLDYLVPILLIFTVQVLALILIVKFVLFRLLGKDYEASVMSAGLLGLLIGATPTALVGMSSVTKKYGRAPQALLLVPLAGASFMDITNSLMLQTIISWFY